MRRAVLACLCLFVAVSAAAQDVQNFDRIYIGSALCALRSGSGTPEASVTGSVCDTYWRTDTGDIYKKITGSATNTGWVIIPRVMPDSTLVEASDILEFYRGTNPKRFNIYNTRASGTDCEYGYAWWNANIYRLGTTKCTSGSNRDMQFEPGAAAALSLTASTLAANFSADILPTANFSGMIGNSAKKFSLLYAGELVVETLVAQNTQATIGGRIIVAPTNLLTAALAAAGTTITVKYNNLTNGDRIYLEAAGNVEWMAVTSSAGGSAGAYTYTVTRNLDGTGANDWIAGDAVLDTGTTGNGYLDIFSTTGVLSGTGPTIIGNVRTGTTYNNISPRWAIGNLKSIFNYSASDVYGAAFGDPSATYITIDATNGIRFRNSTTNKLVIDTGGGLTLTSFLELGTSSQFYSTGVSGFASGTGFWMDYNAGTPRWRVGNPSGAQASWNGTTFAITDGSLSFNSGAVLIDTTGMFISPSSGSGGSGGGFNNTKAVRWTTDTTYYTALWRNDDTGGSPFRNFNLESIFDNLADTYMVIRNKNAHQGTTAAFSEGVLKLRGFSSNMAETLLTAHSYDTTTDRYGYVYLGADDSTTLRSACIGVGAPPALTGSSITTGCSFSVGISMDPTGGLAVTGTFSTQLDVTDGTTTSTYQAGFFGTSSSHNQVLLAGNSTQATLCTSGGVVVATPGGVTGGCKGSGTINANAVYDDNTLLTDWVFEEYYAPERERSSSRRLFSLADTIATTRTEHRLPWMPTAAEFETERKVGGMITRLWQGQEQQQIYIAELEARIAALEQKGGRQ